MALNHLEMALSHLQPPRGLPVAVAVLAARCAPKLDPGILLLWRWREVPGGTGRLLWGFLRLSSSTPGGGSGPLEASFELRMGPYCGSIPGRSKVTTSVSNVTTSFLSRANPWASNVRTSCL